MEKTPLEIELELRAYRARQRDRLERMDALAWLTGRYAAIGWHAPKKYPKRPDAVRPMPDAMTDAEMKRTLWRIAQKEERL